MSVLRNSSLHYVLNKMVKHSSVTGVLELSVALTTDLDLDRVRLTVFLIC